MKPEDRQKITDWLAANLIPAPGSYAPAAHIRAALYEDTAIFVSTTFLGHQILATRSSGGAHGTLYLDYSLESTPV